MATDYYEVLGVARDADEGTIKRAYRQLARKYHPDVADDKAAAENRFKAINEAYEVLSDATKRANYDRFGHAGVNGAGGMGEGFNPFGSEGFGDIFDMFFGAARAGAGGAQQRRNGPARGSDLRYDVEISLEEAYHGTVRDISFRHLANCQTCRGSGAEPGTLVVPCDRCGGSGMQRQVRQTPLGQFVTQTTCSRCNGDGQVVQTPCAACRGRGRIEQEKRAAGEDPAGRRRRLADQDHRAAAKRDCAAAPTAICTSTSRSRSTRCSGATASTCCSTIPISFPQAALGGEIEVPSLDGELPLHAQRRDAERLDVPRSRARDAERARHREAATSSSPCTSSSRRSSRNASASCSRSTPARRRRSDRGEVVLRARQGRVPRGVARASRSRVAADATGVPVAVLDHVTPSWSKGRTVALRRRS